MKAYKGFNKDMTCRGFKFEEGETYEEPAAELCKTGFHACEDPMDCFSYYDPAESVYHEVELEDVCDQRESNDSKVCAKRIHIGAQLDIAGLVKAKLAYNLEHATCKKTSGDRGASTSGDWGASTSGNWGASTSGDRGASTSGYRGASTSGDRGAALSGGKASTGRNGVAVARGKAHDNLRVRGGLGALLVIVHEDEDGETVAQCIGMVDGDKIKPDTWYKLQDGNFLEATEDE